MPKATKLLLTPLMLLAAIACNRVPDGVLPKEEMAQLMADLYVGESVVEANTATYSSDSTKRAFRQSIYARHGVTSADVDSSLRWYGYNMERFIDVYDRTIEILNQRNDEARERAGAAAQSLTADGSSMALEGDSVDVWNDLRFLPFSVDLPANTMPFLLKYDPNWEKGDIYTLRLKSIQNLRPIRFTAAIDYSDGSKETYTSTITGDGWHELTFALDSIKNPREIFGAINYIPRPGETAYIDSISLIRTRRQPGSTRGRSQITTILPKRTSTSRD